MSKLIFQGHGSYKIVTNNNMIIYVDPFIPSDYSEPADLILVTHEHQDHNKVELVNQTLSTIILRSKDLNLNGEAYMRKYINGVEIEAVEAYNKNHKKEECSGYILRFDGIVVYCAGDTSLTNDMQNKLPNYGIDYALLPIDGIFNMDAKEASICADYIKAKHTIPIHMKPYEKFDYEIANTYTHPTRIILEPDIELNLTHE